MTLTLTPALARRLAITRQRLAGPRPPDNAAGILDVMRDLGCLQLDPTSAVARSHLIVLWSRLGPFDPAHLDTLLWQEHSLFEYWAHCASIVLTEDYAIYRTLMRSIVTGEPDSPRGRRLLKWLEENKALRQHILAMLRRDGPLPARVFEDKSVANWYSTGWTSNRNVSQMLDHLWVTGKIMVAGRSGLQKLWDLSERCLPAWTPRERLPMRQVVHRAAQKSLRALGVARPLHIQHHFIRGGYPDLSRTLAGLEAKGHIVQVELGDGQPAWPGPWYIHADDMPLLDRLAAGEWEPRTTLLSPFDNLICDRKRTKQLFDFDYTMEIYVPPAKRRYGYYVLPILHGDRLIGRVDPKMDRSQQRLTINAVYAEPGAPMTRKTGRAVAGAIEELAVFLGAQDIAYDRKRVPTAWQREM